MHTLGGPICFLYTYVSLINLKKSVIPAFRMPGVQRSSTLVSISKNTTFNPQGPVQFLQYATKQKVFSLFQYIIGDGILLSWTGPCDSI